MRKLSTMLLSGVMLLDIGCTADDDTVSPMADAAAHGDSDASADIASGSDAHTDRSDATQQVSHDGAVDGSVGNDSSTDDVAHTDAADAVSDATHDEGADSDTDAANQDTGAGDSDTDATQADADAALGDTDVPDVDPSSFLGGGTLLCSISFQSGTMPSGVYIDKVADDSVVVVGAPWNAAKYALKVLIRAGESWHDAGYPRSEIHPTTPNPPAHFAWDHRYRITSAMYFETGTVFPTDGDWGLGELIAGFQLHGDDGYSPVIGFHLSNGKLQVSYRPTDPSTDKVLADYGAMPVGVRLPYEVVYQPATDATGYLRIAIGNVVLVDETGPSNRVGDPTGGYSKYGLYDYWHTVASSLTLYIDDINIYEY